MSDFNRGLKEIVNAKVQRDLVLLEDQEGCVNCKFGEIFALDNQISDAEMLSNGRAIIMMMMMEDSISEEGDYRARQRGL